MSRLGRRFAVVAGGGTAGHVVPVLAVARAIARAGHAPETIEIVGSRRGQEEAMLAQSEFPFTLLPGRGLRRSAAIGDLWTNARSTLELFLGTMTALVRMAKWRPAVVVSVGGYASFPAGLAAAVFRVPLVLVNIDAVPGLVHRNLNRFASASAVAFPGTALRRAVVTGTPVRAEITRVRRTPGSRARARQELGLPDDRDLIVAFGGSLGAGRINDALRDLVQDWHDRKDVAVYHVVGRRNWETIAAKETERRTSMADRGLWYRAVPFEERMDLLYEAADLAVCRAGAMTVGELAITGVPSVLVPLPGAPDDHQTANAQILVEAGAAILVQDAQCRGAGLSALLQELLQDPDRRIVMSRAAGHLGKPDAADRVAQVVLQHAR